MSNLFNSFLGNFRRNKILLSISNLLNIISVSLSGFVSFLMVVLLAKAFAYILSLTNSFNFGAIDVQISILGAGMQLSIFILKKAESINKNIQ